MKRPAAQPQQLGARMTPTEADTAVVAVSSLRGSLDEARRSGIEELPIGLSALAVVVELLERMADRMHALEQDELDLLSALRLAESDADRLAAKLAAEHHRAVERPELCGVCRALVAHREAVAMRTR